MALRSPKTTRGKNQGGVYSSLCCPGWLFGMSMGEALDVLISRSISLGVSVHLFALSLKHRSISLPRNLSIAKIMKIEPETIGELVHFFTFVCMMY